MPREILTDWVTPAGSNFVSVMFFDTTATVATQRTSINTLLAACLSSLNNQYTYTVRTTGRTLDDASGVLTGTWAEPTARTGTGGSSGEPIPDATQVLFRWGTNTIVNGRIVQGRTYLPGLITTGLQDGNLDPTVISGFDTVAAAFAAAANDFGVWHRPVQGAGGSFHQVDSGSVWPELAVLRRRRG